MSPRTFIFFLGFLGTLWLSDPVRADPHFDQGAFFAALEHGKSPEDLRPFFRRPIERPIRPQKVPPSDEIQALGERLFFDTTLSKNGPVGCVTCHQPAASFSDNRPHSAERGGRRSMTLLNLAWADRFGWVGAIPSLMSQAALAIEAPGGMATPRDEFVDRVRARPEYRRLFEKAFSGKVPDGAALSFDTIVYAFEHYVASLVSKDAAFDRWIEGDYAAVSPAARRGFALFTGKARCARCHMSWRFTDDETHDIGLSPDRGLGDLSPDKQGSQFHFKTPGLRSVEERAPYMHNGTLSTLEEVVLFYNRGGNYQRATKSADVRPLGLGKSEVEDLVEFLKTLSDR